MQLVFLYLYVYGMVFLFGAVIGSFLNVVIYRLPAGTFFAEKRSYCPTCKKQLKAYDLIPVLSYLILGGRCRFCKEKISPRYPLIELLGGGMAVLCVFHFGFAPEALWAFGVLAVFTAITMIDFDTMEIPDSLHVALIPFAVWAVFLFPEISLLQRGIGIFIISLPLLLLALWKEGAFGGADIKFCAVCGFLLGFPNMVLTFFIALLLGGGYAIFLLLRGSKTKQDHIAFGPYLCIGAAVALFFGEKIIGWYLSFFRG